MKKIYALFSIENNYDQPENNLEKLWVNKPNFHDLRKCFDKRVKDGQVGDLMRGRKVDIYQVEYRVEEVSVEEN